VSLCVSVCLVSYRHLNFAVPTHISSYMTTQIYCSTIDNKFGGLGVRKLVSPFVSFIQTPLLCCTHKCFLTNHYSYVWDRHWPEIRRIRRAETLVSVCLFLYRQLTFAEPITVSQFITTYMYCTLIDQKFGWLGLRKLVSPFVPVHTDTVSWLYPHHFFTYHYSNVWDK
jgi:hypothetical protein